MILNINQFGYNFYCDCLESSTRIHKKLIDYRDDSTNDFFEPHST